MANRLFIKTLLTFFFNLFLVAFCIIPDAGNFREVPTAWLAILRVDMWLHEDTSPFWSQVSLLRKSYQNVDRHIYISHHQAIGTIFVVFPATKPEAWVLFFEEAVLGVTPHNITETHISSDYIDGPDMNTRILRKRPDWNVRISRARKKRRISGFDRNDLGELGETDINSRIEDYNHVVYPGAVGLEMSMRTRTDDNLERREADPVEDPVENPEDDPEEDPEEDPEDDYPPSVGEYHMGSEGEVEQDHGIDGEMMWVKQHAWGPSVAGTAPDEWDYKEHDKPWNEGLKTYWHRSDGKGSTVYIIDSGLNLDGTGFQPHQRKDRRGPYMWAGPYAEPWRKQDPDNHGTGVAFQVIGFSGFFAGRVNLKAVKLQPTSPASLISNLGFVDAFVKIYRDILANHPRDPVIINLSYCILRPDTTDTRPRWIETALRSVFLSLRNLGNVVITVSAGNGKSNVPVDCFPARLGAEAEFKDFIIPVGGVRKWDFQNKFQQADWLKIWASADTVAPKYADHDTLESVSGTSYAAPAAAAVLAYFGGMGMTIQQAVYALYDYAYDRRDPEKFQDTPAPKVIYNGARGIWCGLWAADGPRDWDKFFWEKGTWEDNLAHGLLGDFPHGPGDKITLAYKHPEHCPTSTSTSSSSSEADSSTSSETPSESSETPTETLSLPTSAPAEEEEEGGEGEAAPEPTPTPVDVEPVIPTEAGVVLWSPLGWLAAEAVIVLGGVIILVVQLSNGTSATITTSLTGLTSGQTVALATLIPSSLDVKTHPAMTVPTNIAKTTDKDFGIPPPTRAFSTSQLTPTNIIITGPAWTSTVTHPMIKPPLSWSTAVANPPIKFPSKFHKSTVTLTAAAPKDSTVNHCNGLKLANTDSGSLDKGFKFIYQYANRELIAQGIHQVCLRRPGLELKNGGGSWIQLFYDGSPEAFELDMIWLDKYPTEVECLDNFFHILDGCDNDKKENPENWKGGGMREVKGGNSAVYRINTLYSRKPPRKVWGACYINEKWFDFEKWQDGVEFVVWGFGWMDAVNIHQEPDGNVDFQVDLDACQIIHFFWKWVRGPLGPDTPWEWRAQVIVKNDKKNDACVLNVLRKWSKISDLKCTTNDLEKDVTYFPEYQRRYFGKGVAPARVQKWHL
ncbi:hypothetical protein TWF679_004481 [Orbilia oligospora]|uniref:Peptidase S8/S53 domain-containing protein n=1 Tax=Orbilia oligospora TaxID=2813651 RepID=A0A8H8VEB5_ORBOL|nr:hypothetical protein TWF679_004481 [Orbilia oligospora]